jgi:FAD dependent oxidoreductase
MIREPESHATRNLKTEHRATGLVVVGGGLAGTCAAITAARQGVPVVLVQDRPVLGGNASSEVRLWILGATSHMGNNNRWAREGGVLDEILVENVYRNSEGNPLILDAILLEKVVTEPNIQLLLNTAVYEVRKSGPDRIESVTGFCSQNSTRYELEAPLFCDASGDGVVAFLAGAAFRMGAESREEFGEGFAPEKEYGELLGHSLYFYSKDTGRPVTYVPPSFALRDIQQIPRYRDIRAGDSGCRFWWFEYGGKLDTVHETEQIKWELWKVAYGVWDYIKNSGQFPEAKTLTLEWVGTIPGKRESRRFEGEVILKQPDLVEQREWEDAVSFGGWAMDLHPAEGVFSALSPCTQWHSKGVYQIPYRTMFSRNIHNLFLAGRIISASHVAFGSTRVMATCAHNAQAVGMAAALCHREKLIPADLTQPDRMRVLRRELLKSGQYIPGAVLEDADDVARAAQVEASSRYLLTELPPNGTRQPLDASRAMLLPLSAGRAPAISFRLDVEEDTVLEAELQVSERLGNFTPEVKIGCRRIPLRRGDGQLVRIDFEAVLEQPQYAAVCLLRNPAVSVHLSDERVTGVLSLAQTMNKAVAKGARQDPPPGIGIDSFEFWLPSRRPGGKNMAIRIDPPLDVFAPASVLNGVTRPTVQPNAWVAARDAIAPRLTLRWDTPMRIGRIELVFDTDFDHPLESVLLGHPEREIPFCVKHYRILSARDALLFECEANHQTRNSVVLGEPVSTSELHVEVLETYGAPAALFELRCYEA